MEGYKSLYGFLDTVSVVVERTKKLHLTPDSRHSKFPKLYTTLFRVKKKLRKKERKHFQNFESQKVAVIYK